jgi:hypothetical protein
MQSLQKPERLHVRKCAPIAPIVVLALIFDAETKTLHGMYRHHLNLVRSEAHEGTFVDYRLFYYSPASRSLDHLMTLWIG